MSNGIIGHRKRCRRYDVPWQAHYLTFSCLRRQPFFPGRYAAQWLLESVDAARKAEPFDLWAFAIMPEHVHLLILPHTTTGIARILWRIKKPMSDRVLAYVKTHHAGFLSRMEARGRNGAVMHRFWQPGGGYDRNLWTPEMIHQKIRYIHDNPVRRGLVQYPVDWRWSSAKAWESGVDKPLRLDRDSVPIWIH